MKLEQIIEGLIGTKKFKKFAWDYFEQYMFDQNFVLLGSGAQARVYGHPNKNYVYKVYDNDIAYDDFVSYCLTHNNPHLPLIIKQPVLLSKFFTDRTTQQNFTIVRIERLYELSEQESVFYNAKLQYNIYMYIRFGDNQVFRDHYVDNKAYRGLNDYLNEYPEFQFKSIFLLLVELKKSLGHYVDISKGNILKRKDGTIVIADPLSADLTNQPTMFD